MVTGKDLHYLIKRVIADNDAVLWFKTNYDHINGTKNSDIRKATDQLHSLKLKSTQTIQENVATIEEAFRVLKVASVVPVTDDQKLYHLQEKLEHDARFSDLSIMASSKTSQASYEDTIVAPSGSAAPFSRLDAVSTLVSSCSQPRLLVTS